jgi:YD repeat-containing protein
MPSITYIYDALGRLKSVVDPTGDTAVYAYDAVGNVLSIGRQSSSVVSIIEFTPHRAPVGTSVTIHGTAFSETPGENTVRFNGISATVVSATATQLVTTVPPGTASGTITVATPAGLATSTTPFAVTAVPVAPAITEFSPLIGTAGTAVTISGAHFASTLANNKVLFNRTLALLTSTSTTVIEAAVPPGAGSGRIAVSTPFGETVSAADFFNPPVAHTPADVECTGRIERGESTAVTISITNKIALVVFEGTAGRSVSVGVSEVRFDAGAGLVEVSILGPYGATLADALVGSLGDDIDLESLPDTGTYTIVVDLGVLTGRLTLTLSEPATGTLTIDGPSVTVTLDTPGQDARLTFEGTREQRVDLGISEVSVGTGSGVALISILRPDGATFATRFVGTFGDDIDTEPLPESGTYTIVVDPQRAKPMRLTLTLSEPLTGALTIDGPLVPIALDRPGQDARLRFEGAAGQRLSLGMSEVRFGTSTLSVTVSILKPDGSILAATDILATKTGGDIDTGPLPTTGTYTVVVDAENAGTAGLTLTLSEPVTSTIMIDGPSIPVTLARPGQDARLTFEATAGQPLNLGVTELSFGTGAAGVADVTILRPGGATFAAKSVGVPGDDIDAQPLPESGTYTIIVDPQQAKIMSLTLTLSEPITGTLTLGGPPVPVTLDRPGQDARLTFQGTTGQRVSLRVSDVRFGEGNGTGGKVSILRPDGTTLASTSITPAGSDITTQPLPDTGTHTIVVDPPGFLTVSLTLTLSVVS